MYLNFTTLMDSQLNWTEEIAEEAGMTVDREGFEAAMKEQQERARASAVKGWLNGVCKMKPFKTSL